MIKGAFALINMYDFLEINDRNKLYLIHFIEADMNHYFPIESLMENLSLSRFKVENLIEELNIELALLNLTKLEISNTHFVTTTNINEETIIQLRRSYVRKSYYFHLFEELLYRKTSLAKFAELFFISDSKAYDIKKKLVSILKPLGISIKNGQIKGNEEKIRLLYFDVYYFYFNGCKDIFKVRADEIKTQKSIISAIKDDVALTQKAKLYIFIQIISLRMKNNNYVEIATSHFSTENASLKAYQRYISLKDMEIEQQELLYFSRFLYAENFITIKDTDLGSDNLKLVSQISGDFSQKLIGELLINNKTNDVQEIVEQLLSKINRINFRWLYFKYSTNTFISNNQWKFFEEVYPEFFDFVVSFVENTGFINSEKARKTLFYDYIFALIAIIPMSYLSRSINICIDFSRGKIYSDYISTNILQFQSMDINVTYKPNEQTDLYISDFNSEFVSCKQIIWKEPPNNKDWKNFGNILVKIRGEKKNEKST